jgi:N4-gp56 family major capsid protein
VTAITRNDMNSNVLQTWLRKKTLEVFEPKLFFHKFGERPVIDDGYNTLSWAKFDQIASSSVTTGASTNDGVSPSDTDFDATVISVSPTQFRIVVNLSDMVIERNKIDFLRGAASAVGSAMARDIDETVQTTIMAGDNVKYAGSGNTARTDLAVTDLLTADLLNFAQSFLTDQDAPHWEAGAYMCVIHPFQLYDLRASTAAGSWVDLNKYSVNVSKVFNGEIGMLHGVRVVVSSHVQSFASTTTVYPALVFGRGAYGVGEAQRLQMFLTPPGPTDSDPLAQRRKVGAKVAFGTTILQQASLMRIETGATAVASD